MAIAKKIEGFMEKSSWIRKMFEQGMALKQQYGAENVFDFSLGNPNVDPPAEFFETLERIVQERKPGSHVYMSNAGFPETRAAIAQFLSVEQGVALSDKHVIMSCGAGGGLNVLFRTLLDPGDEILVPAPFFVEYLFYADNHNATCKLVDTTDDFALDLDGIERAMSEKTKIVLVNSPNNPTGRVYGAREIEELGRLVDEKSREFGREI